MLIKCNSCRKVFNRDKCSVGKYNFCSRKCANTPILPKECLVCNTAFLVSARMRNTTRYCSPECKGIAQKNAKTPSKIEIKCQQCGKKFLKPASDIRRGKGKYCSTHCQYRGIRKRIKKTCPICKKTFQTYPHAIKRGKGVFCSDQCFRIHKNTQVTLICENCKAPYKKGKSQARRSRYCSRSCQGAWKARQNYNRTDIEIIVEQILQELKIDYIPQYPISSFVCDFFVKPRLIIEADGVYWHSLPKNMERDLRKDKYLESKGFSVLRLPGDKIREEREWCIQQIKSATKPNGPFKQLSLFD